jgi:hypothetical protein
MSSGASTSRRRRTARKASLSTVVSVRLTLSTGPELFAAVHSAPSASERIKQLATLGLAAERAGIPLDALLPGASPPAAVPRAMTAAPTIPPKPRPVDREPLRPAPLDDVPPSPSADLDAAMLGAQAFGFG